MCYSLHMEPITTGHTECSVSGSGSPALFKLNQINALPFLGSTDIFSFVKTVVPPNGTSVALMKKINIFWSKINYHILS